MEPLSPYLYWPAKQSFIRIMKHLTIINAYSKQRVDTLVEAAARADFKAEEETVHRACKKQERKHNN